MPNFVAAPQPDMPSLLEQTLCEDGHALLGEVGPHLSRAGACWWLSVTNLTTVGYGGIVSAPAPLLPR